MPSFSIIIPTFNRGSVLQRAIQSVFDQDLTDWEVIIIDDGSTDNTYKLVFPFIEKPNFRYFFQKNGGVSKARNFGASKAVTDWLIFLDSDDELTPHALSSFAASIQRNPKIDLFVAGRILNSGKGIDIRIAKETNYYPLLSGTFCLRINVFQKVGGYDPQFSFAENTELFHRIGQLNIRRHVIQEISLIYHESIIGGSKNIENIINSVVLFLNKHHDTMTANQRHLYHQLVAVHQLRFQRFVEARFHLWKAYRLKPLDLKTIARLALSYLPIISKRVYTQDIEL